MKKLIYCVVTLIILLNNSCTEKTAGEILNINIEKPDSLFMSQIADSITYIQLETNEESLLGNIHSMQYRNGIYYIVNP